MTVGTVHMVVHFRSLDEATVRSALSGQLPRGEAAPAVVVYPVDVPSVKAGQVDKSTLVSVGPGWMELAEQGDLSR